jgi:hypothetical protein
MINLGEDKLDMELAKLLTSVSTTNYIKQLLAENDAGESQIEEINDLIQTMKNLLDKIDKGIEPEKSKVLMANCVRILTILHRTKSEEYMKLLKLESAKKHFSKERYDILTKEVFPLGNAITELAETSKRLQKEGKV